MTQTQAHASSTHAGMPLRPIAIQLHRQEGSALTVFFRWLLGAVMVMTTTGVVLGQPSPTLPAKTVGSTLQGDHQENVARKAGLRIVRGVPRDRGPAP
jgi:hypothetical protein